MKRALLVGINYIGTSNELNGCINDIQNMRNFLITKLKYNPNNILILTDNTVQKPTKENIINSLYWLISNNRKKSRLFFHYSGHGTYINDINRDEKDGYDECLVPLDFENNGFIIDDNLKEIFNKIRKGAKLTCVFDCLIVELLLI
jgi:metacaspase-1